MAKSCKDLPDECWELIFIQLLKIHRSHLQSLSLSCKRFLSITNAIRTRLRIYPTTALPISTLLNRFPNIDSIHLRWFTSFDDLHRVVNDIATSDLDLETLDFTGIHGLPLESWRILGTRFKNLTVLSLGGNLNLSDECLAKLASVCPSVEVLDVSSCNGITEKGIAEFWKSGSKIRELRIDDCLGIRNIGNSFELSKLETLRAARSGINDDGLVVIGNRCGRLLKLSLEACSEMTTVGLEEIVRNCKRLRKIDLTGCSDISSGFVELMVISRPSLRKIILPHSSLPSKSQRKLFLRYGCLVLSK